MEHDAELSPVDINEKTPLKIAYEKKKQNKSYQKIVDYLTSKGAQLEWRNPDFVWWLCK